MTHRSAFHVVLRRVGAVAATLLAAAWATQSLGQVTSIVSISAGDQHTCAVINNGPSGPAYCWGRNDSAQVGMGPRRRPWIA